MGYDISRIPTEGWKTVRLPYKQQHVDHNSLWFQTQISIPDEQCRYYLKISGLQCDAIVFVDDQRVGEMKGPEARIDITSAVAPGNDATVSLWVTRWWEGTTLTFETDYMRRATLTSSELARLVSSDPEEIRRRVVLGISEGVWLEARPLLAEIENVFVATSYRNSELTLFVDAISHEDLTGAKFEIRVTELDGTSNGLPSGVFPVSSVGEGPLSQHTITIPWKDPQLWDIGSPYLYYVNVSLLDSNDNVIHEYPPVRFGFREIWTEGKELILNGHPLHLKIAPFVHSIPAMLFFEGIGFNAMLVQPNSDYWFGVKGHGLFPDSTTVRQASNQELLDAADERGWAVLMSAPTFKYSEMEFFMPEAQTQYMEYFKMWMRKLDRQNRPSILTWTPTVNTGINYDPDRLGKIDPSQSSTRGLYVSDETVEKTIVAIWDGIGKRKFRVEWQLVVDGKVLDSGNEFFTMGVGAIEKRPISFTVPRVDVRTDARLSITVYDAETKVRLTDDSFDMAFFPGFDRVEDLKSRWGIYDPFGRTAPELAKIGFEAVPVEMGDSLEDIDVLIIGHRAVTVTGELPFTAQQVEDGLNVVFFEQGLHGLEALGMRGQDIIPRYTFPRVKDHPILANLEPEDLINWRGSGTLLPERSKGMRQWETRRPPHVGNYGSVASVVIETPHQGAFTPIVECEFDLAYSPLVSWKHGKGEVIFSQFDITDRLDVEPVASILAANIIRYADDKSVTASQDGRIVFLQDTGSNEEDIEFINKLGLECVVAGELGSLEVSDVVVIGRDGIGAITANLERLEEHIRAGGAVVVLPQKEDIMNAADLPWDVQVREERLSKALLSASDEGDSVLRGIGPQLVHWRTFLDLAVFTKVPSEGRSLLEGLVLVIDEGTNGGQWIFSQIDWTGLYDKSSLDMIDHLTRPRWNTIKLYRQLFANLGVRSSSETTTSLLGIVKKTYKSAELRERYYGGRLYEEPLDAVKDPYEFFAW
ncbi:MAG: hypothetical protein WBJ60_07580 [Bacillota bacterium]